MSDQKWKWKREKASNISTDQTPDAALTVIWGSGATGAYLQDTFFNVQIYGSTQSANSSSYLDDGATSVVRHYVLTDVDSGVELQNMQESNLWMAAKHKMMPADWCNTVGVNLLGLEGKGLIGSTLLSAATNVATKRIKNFRPASKTIYAIPQAEYFPLEKPWPFKGSQGLRADIQTDSVVRAQTANGGDYVIKANPFTKYIDLFNPGVSRAGFSANYYGYRHFPRSIPDESTAFTHTLSARKFKSVQGLLIVTRTATDITSQTAQTLQSFTNPNYKTIQLRANGQLYPENAMVVGGGTTALQHSVEAYQNLEHFAKLLSRGSKYKIDYPGVGDRFGYTSTTIDADYMIWIPLSDIDATHGSGVSIEEANLVVEATMADPTAAQRVDYFLVYDKSVSINNGVVRVDDVTINQALKGTA